MKVNVIDIGQDELIELGQTTKSKFALLTKIDDDTYQNSTPLMACRDYFNDVMYVQHHPDHELGMQYGFKWEYDEKLANDLDAGKSVFMLFNHDGAYKYWYALHEIEGGLHFNETRVHEVESVENGISGASYKEFVILEVDARWFSNSVMLSLYTMYVRLLAYAESAVDDMFHVAGKVTTGTDLEFATMVKDNLYGDLNHLHKNWQTLLGKNVGQSVDESDEDDCRLPELVHDYSGIMSYMRGINARTRDNVPVAIRTWVDKWKALYVIPEQSTDCDHIEDVQEEAA